MYKLERQSFDRKYTENTFIMELTHIRGVTVIKHEYLIHVIQSEGGDNKDLDSAEYGD